MVSRRSLCNSDEGDSEGRRREAREVSAIILIMIFYLFLFHFPFLAVQGSGIGDIVSQSISH